MATFNQWFAAMEEAFEVFETINELNSRTPRVSSVWLQPVNKRQMKQRQQGQFPKPIAPPTFAELDEQPRLIQATATRRSLDPQLVIRHLRSLQAQQSIVQQHENWLANHESNAGISNQRVVNRDDEAVWDRPYSEEINWSDPDIWRILDQHHTPHRPQPQPRPTVSADGTHVAKPSMREVGDIARTIPGLVSIGWNSTSDEHHHRTIARVRFDRRWQAQRFRNQLSRANWMSFSIQRQQVNSDEAIFYVNVPVKFTDSSGYRPATDNMRQEAQRAETIRQEARQQRRDEWGKPQARFSTDPTSSPHDEPRLDDRALERELTTVERQVIKHLGYDPNASVERVIDQRRKRRDEELRLKRDELDAYIAARDTEQEVVAELHRRGQLTAF